VGQIHRVLHRALGHAVTWGLVRANVAAIAKPPKKIAEEVQILTADQVDAVLTRTKASPLHSIIVVALGTGARRGEIMALRWRDIDLEAGRARVERSLEQTKAGLRFKAPKTKYGRRNVALPSSVVAELRSVWKAQQELRLAMGMGKASPDDLVFSTPEGGPRKPDGVSRDWRQLVASKKLPKVTFHALRHTHVSQLIAKGTDIMTISRRIGHSSPVVTLGVYGHLFDNSDSQAASAIEASFGKLRTE
jgi:integrase